MRILIIQYMFLNDGSTNALMELLKGLLRQGYEIQTIYSRYSERIAELDSLGIKSIQVPFLRSSDRGYCGLKKFIYYPLLLLVNAGALCRMAVVARRFKPQIVHTNVSPIHIGYYLSRILGVPHLWHLREFLRREDRSQPTFGYDYFLKLLNKSNTVATTRAIKDYYGLPNCKVVYDGVIKDCADQPLPLLAERKDSFLFVGRVEQSKGIELLIDAFSQFVHENNEWQLDVVVSNDYKKELQDRIQALGIADKVKFLGVRNNVPQMMKERKAVVVSSLSEGFGIVTVEAMNNKCFVIANDNTGTKEQLDNARELVGSDVAYRFTTAGELLQQMRRFVNEDNVILQQVVDKAYEVVNSLYGVEKYVSEIAKCYEIILNRTRE